MLEILGGAVAVGGLGFGVQGLGLVSFNECWLGLGFQDLKVFCLNRASRIWLSVFGTLEFS